MKNASLEDTLSK